MFCFVLFLQNFRIVFKCLYYLSPCTVFKMFRIIKPKYTLANFMTFKTNKWQEFFTLDDIIHQILFHCGKCRIEHNSVSFWKVEVIKNVISFIILVALILRDFKIAQISPLIFCLGFMWIYIRRWLCLNILPTVKP